MPIECMQGSMVTFESILMFLGSTVCHQLPERSYVFDGFQMPLCARCIGIHFGFFLSTLFFLTGSRRFASGLPGVKQMLVLGAIMSFFLVDAGLSYSGISTSDNLRRTLSGLSLGVPFPFVLYPLLNAILLPGRNPRVILQSRADWGWLAGLYGLGAVLILSSVHVAADFYFVSVAGVVGVFVFFTVLFSIVVSLLAENMPMPARNKVAAAAVLAVVVLMILAAVHEAFFPNI
ncbi:MAG: DUF2085 domain-containing protein [Candidatus Thermoplasmatota archaeon]|nr:DUF2085 domain-containing protein [Candidatus Thermoplasmatota archaeon]